MEVQTFRAASMQEALAQVRDQLGPDAAVLETRQIGRGLLNLLGPRQIEVTASRYANIAPRLTPPTDRLSENSGAAQTHPPSGRVEGEGRAFGEGESRQARGEFAGRQSEETRSPSPAATASDPPGGRVGVVAVGPPNRSRTGTERAPHSSPSNNDQLQVLRDELLRGEMSDRLADEFLERLSGIATPSELHDPVSLRRRLLQMLEDEISIGGSIELRDGRQKLVALVGPTGVGKTTTIAKLAAHFHVVQRCRVGLITVDTYRIAAVEQLRTYAEIIDLPMEVVSTPREAPAARKRLAGCDLILLDSAGRSPRDDVEIQALGAMLAAVEADEVHLVLSAASTAGSLTQTAERFASLGVGSLLLTKLDEAAGLGNLPPLLRHCGLPLSYVTDGQNVPDDLAPADRTRLAERLLGRHPTKPRPPVADVSYK